MLNTHLDPLISISGQRIETVSDWENFRREEIMVLLENFIYGVRPMERPDDLSFTVTKIEENFKGYPLVKKSVVASFCGFDMPFAVFIPGDLYGKKPVPAFIHILNETHFRKEDPANRPDNDFLPITEIAARGYGVIVLSTYDVSPDWPHKPEYKQGVFRAIQPDVSKRNCRSWGNISGWAYGVSRVMDYLEIERDIDHTRIGVCGHSRAGKTALWAGATDQRIALVISNCSGCSGAAYTRNKEGEHIKDINISDWFCGNYHRYDDNEEMLPLDQHFLLAAIAPRPLYVKSCVEDSWAGPEEELKSCRLASPVYELYGLKGFDYEGEIKTDTPYQDGMIAYHRTHGDHDLIRMDWQFYMDFADKHLKGE